MSGATIAYHYAPCQVLHFKKLFNKLLDNYMVCANTVSSADSIGQLKIALRHCIKTS
ncbi:MAG: hypothetical protein K2Q14_00135 [Gammaproteobacteria bacterium]|nr:hypothetical protein [Gammaproteobacteria bacterium]